MLAQIIGIGFMALCVVLIYRTFIYWKIDKDARYVAKELERIDRIHRMYQRRNRFKDTE